MRAAAALFLILVIVVTGLSWYFWNSKFQALEAKYDSAIAGLIESLNKQRAAFLEFASTLNRTTKDLERKISSVQDYAKEGLSSLTGAMAAMQNYTQSVFLDLEKRIRLIRLRSGDFSALVPEVIQSVVVVYSSSGHGSGVALSPNLILTAAHVAEPNSTIKTFSGELLPGQLIAEDDWRDLALIAVSASLPELELGQIGSGQRVIAIGSPGGLEFTVTEGTVSALRLINGVCHIQHDVPVNPGSSGGPLIDRWGKLVGINTKKLANYEGIGFAICPEAIADWLRELNLSQAP